MFPRRYFPGRYFAPRYWPESEGEEPAVPTQAGQRFCLTAFDGRGTERVAFDGRGRVLDAADRSCGDDCG